MLLFASSSRPLFVRAIRCFAIFAFFAIGLCWNLAISSANDPESVFEREVRPILERYCVECHNVDDSNGGLNLTSPAALSAETDSGSIAIAAGAPDTSEILVRIQTSDEGSRMPPEGECPTQNEIETLRQWIQDGATWPRTSDEEDHSLTTDHWSFQPLHVIEPPTVKDDSWAYTAIDRFVQAARDEANLDVLGDATPEQQMRRVSYTLTGLPPNSERVQGLVARVLSGAEPRQELAAYIDELLSQPTYGERWGRHWMDWVRYADTAGCNSDFPIPQAYLYRNYIIDSFNADVPYDRFLVEQLAGDLLPYESLEERNRQIIAT
ncbi:MAG: DUF1549 domain-containing protein, partial [Planctomycetota bacterium]